MSSAENEPRPVWLTREQRNWLNAIRLRNEFDDTFSGEIVAAWDAAPADPAEAAATALEEAAGRATLNARVVSYREAADAVLAALGAPKATP